MCWQSALNGDEILRKGFSSHDADLLCKRQAKCLLSMLVTVQFGSFQAKNALETRVMDLDSELTTSRAEMDTITAEKVIYFNLFLTCPLYCYSYPKGFCHPSKQQEL